MDVLRRLKNCSNSVRPGQQEIIQSNLSHHRDTNFSASLQSPRPTAASNQDKQTLLPEHLTPRSPRLALQSTLRRPMQGRKHTLSPPGAHGRLPLSPLHHVISFLSPQQLQPYPLGFLGRSPCFWCLCHSSEFLPMTFRSINFQCCKNAPWTMLGTMGSASSASSLPFLP